VPGVSRVSCLRYSCTALVLHPYDWALSAPAMRHRWRVGGRLAGRVIAQTLRDILNHTPTMCNGAERNASKTDKEMLE
jgi:hypothetical protein